MSRRNSPANRRAARSPSRPPDTRPRPRTMPMAPVSTKAAAGRCRASWIARSGASSGAHAFSVVPRHEQSPVPSAGVLRAFNLHVLNRFFVFLTVYIALSVSTGLAAPSVAQFKLANGLAVVVIPDHRTPVVTHMLWYRVGAADEVNGKSGIAHFLEHLMFKGTAKNPAGRFSQQLATVGGQENAFTASDYTGYFQRTSREHLGTLMEFEADRMTGLVLTDDVVASERNVILEERNQRIDNEPSARLGEQVQAAQYLNHPYHRPTIGWRHEMETLDRQDAIKFFRRYYQPNNAFLIVAGDVTVDEVKELAEKTYGKIEKRTPIGPRVRAKEPPQIAERRLSFADLRVSQPSLQ